MQVAAVVRDERLADVAPAVRVVVVVVVAGVRLVLALVLVAAVGELDQQRQRRAGQQLAVEDVDDFVALLPRFHPVFRRRRRRVSASYRYNITREDER